MEPLLSIVIATKNRVQCCINCIETILAFQNNDFELIIQDNTDNLELSDYIKINIQDTRLVYNYTPPPFSSIDNFNAAFALASGEYICLIGDDDGINPEFFKIARFAKENEIDSLGSTQLAEYYWPGANERYKDGNLSIPEFTGTAISFDPKKRLIPLLMTGIVNYTPFHLPRVYHGLVKRSLLEKIKEKSGHYFAGLSPDIYSSIALTMLVEKHVIVDYPITIAGICALSTSASNQNGEHSGRLEDAPHFRNRGNYVWESIVPRYYSIQTIWAETGIKALKDFDQQNLLKYFSLKFLVAQSIINNTQITDLILEQAELVVRAQKKSVALFLVQVYLLKNAIRGRRFINILKRRFHKREDNKVYYNGILNVRSATEVLNNYMVKRNFDVFSLLGKK